ncbi:MAG: hypothetical protein ACLR1T_01385 [Evtepia gabavorous]
MDLQEYLARMNSGEPVEGGGEMHRFMREINEVTMRLTCEAQRQVPHREEIREIFSKIIGKPVDKSFRLFPPSTPTAARTPRWAKGSLSTPAATSRTRAASPWVTVPLRATTWC